MKGLFERWDWLDVVTVIGVGLLVIGFVLAFIPKFRSGGALFLVGVILIAVAAYGARKKDGDEN